MPGQQSIAAFISRVHAELAFRSERVVAAFGEHDLRFMPSVEPPGSPLLPPLQPVDHASGSAVVIQPPAAPLELLPMSRRVAAKELALRQQLHQQRGSTDPLAHPPPGITTSVGMLRLLRKCADVRVRLLCSSVGDPMCRPPELLRDTYEQGGGALVAFVNECLAHGEVQLAVLDLYSSRYSGNRHPEDKDAVSHCFALRCDPSRKVVEVTESMGDLLMCPADALCGTWDVKDFTAFADKLHAHHHPGVPHHYSDALLEQQRRVDPQRVRRDMHTDLVSPADLYVDKRGKQRVKETKDRVADTPPFFWQALAGRVHALTGVQIEYVQGSLDVGLPKDTEICGHSAVHLLAWACAQPSLSLAAIQRRLRHEYTALLQRNQVEFEAGLLWLVTVDPAWPVSTAPSALGLADAEATMQPAADSNSDSYQAAFVASSVRLQALLEEKSVVGILQYDNAPGSYSHRRFGVKHQKERWISAKRQLPDIADGKLALVEVFAPYGRRDNPHPTHRDGHLLLLWFPPEKLRANRVVWVYDPTDVRELKSVPQALRELLDINMFGRTLSPSARLKRIHVVTGPQSEDQDDCYALAFACLGWLHGAGVNDRVARLQSLGVPRAYKRWV